MVAFVLLMTALGLGSEARAGGAVFLSDDLYRFQLEMIPSNRFVVLTCVKHPPDSPPRVQSLILKRKTQPHPAVQLPAAPKAIKQGKLQWIGKLDSEVGQITEVELQFTTGDFGTVQTLGWRPAQP